MTANSFGDVLVLLVGLLFSSSTMSLVVHGWVVVDELAKGLLAELGRQVLLVAVEQVPNTVALLK